MLDGRTPWSEEPSEHYRPAGRWQGENLADLLTAAVEAHGERTALVHGPLRLTYAELGRRVARTAAGFVAQGIAPGERVLVRLPNGPAFVIVTLALFRMGAQPVFSLLPPRPGQLPHLCALSGAVACVVPGRYEDPARHEDPGRYDDPGRTRPAPDLATQCATLRKVFVLDAGAERAAPPAPEGLLVALDQVDAEPLPPATPDPSDVAFLLLSGGTEQARLVPRTHDDYAYQIRAAAELLELDASDVYLAVLPAELNFTWGCPGVVGTLASGGTVVLMDAPRADECFAAVERQGVTFTSLVPALAQSWLEVAEGNTADLSSLQLVQIGGARLPASVVERIRPVLGCRLQQVYGVAEGQHTFTRDTDAEDEAHGAADRVTAGDAVL
ncbi:AMP-binding protein [Streptomyces sp. NPDC005409]|uniref:AMP-binding protein n=1 Tax=Streptomyces sp. NPDC005409 TaxID=3155342 RepID=UPI0034537C07